MATISLATLALYMGGLRAARSLHRQLLASVLRSPLNTFFDVTPVGRILNRFSADVNEVDNEFPSVIRGFANCFFSVRSRLQFVVVGSLFSGPLLSSVFPHSYSDHSYIREPSMKTNATFEGDAHNS